MSYEGKPMNPFLKPRRAKSRLFEMRPHGPRTPDEIRRDREARERLRRPTKPESGDRIRSVIDLHEHLVSIGHPEACDSQFACDPWKYEPILFRELMDERTGTNDAERIAELRGLVRAGSWTTYDQRRSTTEVVADLRDIERRETQELTSRIRQSDPDTAKELAQELKRIGDELAAVEQAIRTHRAGDDLEPAVRTIEDLNIHAWRELRKFMAAHGLDIATARSHPVAHPLFKTIERFRPLRDELYLRRLLPQLAKTSTSLR